jgi:hypothetical protein
MILYNTKNRTLCSYERHLTRVMHALAISEICCTVVQQQVVQTGLDIGQDIRDSTLTDATTETTMISAVATTSNSEEATYEGVVVATTSNSEEATYEGVVVATTSNSEETTYEGVVVATTSNSEGATHEGVVVSTTMSKEIVQQAQADLSEGETDNILGAKQDKRQHGYPWQENNLLLECPPCRLHGFDAAYVLLTQRNTWLKLIESIVAVICVNVTHPLVCCWIQHKPMVANVTIVCIQILTFVLLNSVEYSVLSHTASSIRGQAMCLFIFSYIFFFVCCSSLIMIDTLVTHDHESAKKSCRRQEIEFTVITTIAATIIRFATTTLFRIPCLRVYSVRVSSTRMSHCQLICGSLCSIVLIVQGITLHIYAALEEINTLTSILAYIVTMPSLYYLQRHREPANEECVWNMWTTFMFVFIPGMSLSWPVCMLDAGFVTQQSTVTACCIGVVLTIIGSYILFRTISAVTLPPKRSFDYMYTY